MEKFSLPTFLKVCLMDTGSRIAEIKKKLEQGSGYDFYNSFQRASRIFCNEKDYGRALDVLAAPVKEAERKYNSEAFEAFRAKFGSSRSLEEIKKPRTFKLEGANFEITIDPLFSLEKAGVRYAYLPWVMQKPDLSQRYAAVACYVMRQAYKGTNLSNHQFNVYDLTKGKSFSESQINENTARILATDARMISNLLAEL